MATDPDCCPPVWWCDGESTVFSAAVGPRPSGAVYGPYYTEAEAVAVCPGSGSSGTVCGGDCGFRDTKKMVVSGCAGMSGTWTMAYFGIDPFGPLGPCHRWEATAFFSCNGSDASHRFIYDIGTGCYYLDHGGPGGFNALAGPAGTVYSCTPTLIGWTVPAANISSCTCTGTLTVTVTDP